MEIILIILLIIISYIISIAIFYGVFEIWDFEESLAIIWPLILSFLMISFIVSLLAPILNFSYKFGKWIGSKLNV